MQTVSNNKYIGISKKVDITLMDEMLYWNTYAWNTIEKTMKSEKLNVPSLFTSLSFFERP